ncbi:MAG TPA: ABC transporter substrate-binding protein, partial [Casimicrobiaceae bacterium]|nr:ABC transporter substrate-binding protein [Casimicrobiaceae bacterium]
MKPGAQRVRWILAIAFAFAFAFACAAGAADPNKILRVAANDIDTLDPHQYNDNPSFEVLISIFEPLYEWAYLESPPKLAPLTAAAPIEIGDGGKRWTMRVKPGILFTDDPAFKGKPRELVAEDYVYSYKRWLDPNGRRGGAPIITDLIVGARAVVDAARASGKFDYDRPIEGLRALDRYTLELRLMDVDYANVQDMIGFVGAAAREVVEAAGADIRSRAVGTGPFRLREWKRGSRIILDANPGYRQARFPASDDPARAALVKSMHGKTVPAVGVVEVNIIDEELTRLLQFEQGGIDYLALRGEIASRLLVNGKLKPEYVARGVTRHVHPEPYLFSFNFNIADPVIGGMSNDRVALRRAIGLAFDLDTLVKVVYGGQALPANQIVPPGVAGHDPTIATKPQYDPVAARTLLDRFGYANKDAEGFRTGPDGKPLTITVTLRSGALSREIQTLWKKNMDAIGLRMDFHVTPFQDAIKEMQQGQFQIIFRGFGGSPSGYPELLQLYSKQPRRINAGLFNLPSTTVPRSNFCAAGPPPNRSLRRARCPSSRERTCPCFPRYFVSRTISCSRGCADSARRYSRPTGSISTSTSIGGSKLRG